jgi:deoxyribodipyrimidine photo-lyase
MVQTSIAWLRNDLRVEDNPALAQAASHSDHVVAIYIHEETEGVRTPGAAARWWIHQSLQKLEAALASLGIALDIRSGESGLVMEEAVKAHGAGAVFWNRRYAPGECRVDGSIKAQLRAAGVNAESCMGNVLVEPWTIATGQGKPYSVYTPFWNALRRKQIDAPVAAPSGRLARPSAAKVDVAYRAPKWSGKFEGLWEIGEAAAHGKLARFFDNALAGYAEGRDYPARESTTKLSPHLRHGEISPRQVWHAAQHFAQAHPERADAINKFLSELAWRDFNYHQLFYRPDIATVPMQAKYSGLGWRDAPEEFATWTRGQTGIPIVDAGMREMWATGFMQNRVRMLTASLLTKNLLIDWRRGEQWFWDCLVDADPANNAGNWQWVSGSGLDASPFFRIFNPATQGERFDADGEYVRRWVPELRQLGEPWLHNPAAAPQDVLRKAGVELGHTYPLPIVDLKLSRLRALEAVRAL